MSEDPVYADGRRYLAPMPRSEASRTFLLRPRLEPVFSLGGFGHDWYRLWFATQRHLHRAGLSLATRKAYRGVLRSFKTFMDQRTGSSRPADVTALLAGDFIYSLVERGSSWSWLGFNISVLRTIFDKFGGLSISRHLRTPRRPQTLVDILSASEVDKMLNKTDSLRDRLIIALMYGSGLKPGEVCRLKWQDVDIKTRSLFISDAPGRKQRNVALPEMLMPILSVGVRVCDGKSFVFPGGTAEQALSERTLCRVVARSAKAAALSKRVTCMTLRHSYAVARLREGMSIPELQAVLGHRDIETTMHYHAYTATDGIQSPADNLDVWREEKDGDSQDPPSADSGLGIDKSHFRVDGAKFPLNGPAGQVGRIFQVMSESLSALCRFSTPRAGPD